MKKCNFWFYVIFVLFAAVSVMAFISCPTEDSTETPPAPLNVKNFTVTMSLTPLNGDITSGRYVYRTDGKNFSAIITWEMDEPADKFTGIKIEISGNPDKTVEKTEKTGSITIDGFSNSNYTFTATPQGAVEGQTVNNSEQTPTVPADTRNGNQKAEAWVDDPARIITTTEYWTIQDVKDFMKSYIPNGCTDPDSAIQVMLNTGFIS